MGLKKSEVFGVIGNTFLSVEKAMEENSPGGEDITKKEVADLIIGNLSNAFEQWKDKD